MRYWVYINDKVDGPYEEDKLVTLQGFTPDTLICAEEIAAGGSQEWVKASSIFEFDQVQQPANQPLPAEEVFNTQTAHSEPLASEKTLRVENAANGDVNKLLLEKIDFLTREITGLQEKLDDMKNKLDAAILSSHYTQPAAAQSYSAPQANDQHTITLTRQDVNEENEDALITNTESLVSQAENIVAAANQEEKPLDMLGPVDLGDKKQDATPTEVSLGSKAEEEVVLRSALDSLYNAKTVQTQEEKESTFQDLLTPQQAKILAEQAAPAPAEEAHKPTLDEALKEVQKADEALTAHEAEKDALLKELTAEPKEDVLDQVIKEREEEKKAETFKMAQAAAVGAAAGVAAAAALHPAEESEKKEEVPGLETVEEAAAEPVEEKKTLDFTDENASPALSIAPDRAEPEKQEEVKPASEMPADVPAEQTPAQTQPDDNMPHLSVLPSSDEMPGKTAAPAEEDKKEETVQELVPGAKTEKPDGVLITEEDLNEAFSERNNDSNQSVEQLFGLAPEQTSDKKEEAPAPASQEPQTLPQFSDQTADKPLPMGNPNDLTEIELKEGSTYLISDFVPPAQTNGNELPKEISKLDAKPVEEKVPQQNAQETKPAEVQEMVSPLKQTEKPAEAAADAPKDVTVSQIILENTIKTKRGATLDIKTVPMVPEPAQSDRLHLDNMDDDLNTQHDLKAADVKPAGKTTKLVAGTLVTVVLAALIYVMLAFMNLIPPQFNLLSSEPTAQQVAEQNAQMDEMLGTQAQPAAQPAAQQTPAANPMDTVLDEVKNYPLMNGYTLKQFIEAKHPAAKDLITWDISTAVDPDNYSVLVKVPPENPQSFKISYRFNYNTVTKALDPTISDAKNLLDSASQGAAQQGQPAMAPVQGGNMTPQPAPAQAAPVTSTVQY